MSDQDQTDAFLDRVEEKLERIEQKVDFAAEIAIRAEAVATSSEVVLYEIDRDGQASVLALNMLRAALDSYREQQRIAAQALEAQESGETR